MSYLTEAFRELQGLNEEMFNISNNLDDLSKLRNFFDTDVESAPEPLEILDPDAESIEDLQDSYIGKAVIECTVCHRHQFKDKDDLLIDDETGLVNVEDECPYCFSQDGYQIVGEVAPYVEETDDEPVVTVDGKEVPVVDAEDVDDNADEIKLGGDDEDEDDLDEGLLTHAVDTVGSVANNIVNNVGNVANTLAGKDSIIANTGLGDNASKVAGAYKTVKECDKSDKDTNDTLNEDLIDPLDDYNDEIVDWLADHSREYLDACDYFGVHDLDSVSKDELVDWIYGRPELAKEYEAFFAINEGLLGTGIGAAIGGALGGPIGAVAGGLAGHALTDTNESMNDVCPDCGKNPCECSDEELNEDYDDEDDEEWDDEDDSDMYQVMLEKIQTLAEQKFPGIGINIEVEGSWQGGMGSDFLFISMNNDEAQQEFDSLAEGDSSICLNGDIMDMSPNGVVKRVYDLFKLIGFNFKKYRNINESFEHVNVETEDSIMDMSQDDNGKVTVTTEPKKEETTGDEMLAPIDLDSAAEVVEKSEDEVIDQLESEDDEITAEGDDLEEDSDGDQEEVDIEGFDEESFDELGESYVKKVYSNVASYKTESVKDMNNKMIVEGLVTYNDGKTCSTKFIFTPRYVRNNGKVSFLGENKMFSSKPNAFRLLGRVENKGYISEALQYNYMINESKVCGKVTSKKLLG